MRGQLFGLAMIALLGFAAAPGLALEPSGDAIEFNIIADATTFSVDEIVVSAGQEVTIIVKDKDTMSDEPHNFHVRAGDANYFTLIKAAPNTQSITFTIDTPGVYEFFCDTHLTEMAGVFIVEG